MVLKFNLFHRTHHTSCNHWIGVFFKPLKCAYNAACSSWLRKHPARRISVDKIAELFKESYHKATTMENVVSGFRCTGIVPFSKEILPAGTFLSDPRDKESDASPSKVVTSAIATSQKPINADLPSDPIPCSSSSPQYSSPDTTPAVLPSPDLSDIAETSSVTFDSILKVPCIVERVKTKRSEESKKKRKK